MISATLFRYGNSENDGATRDFRGMRLWRNSTETQQSSHASKSVAEIKDSRSRAKNRAPKRLRCGVVEKKVS